MLAFLQGILVGIELVISCVLTFFIYGCGVMVVITFVLAEKYEPVRAKWTTERCAVCRWVEDWDYNKIIICNR